MKYWLKILLFFPIWLLFCGIFYGIIFIIFPELYNSAGKDFEKMLTTNYLILIVSQIAIFSGTLFSILFISKFIDKTPPKYLKSALNFKGVIHGFGLGIILINLSVVIVIMTNDAIIKYLGFNLHIFIYLIVFFFAAIAEEIMSRGFIFNALYENINKVFAIIISSIIFALIHILNASLSFVGILNIFLAGVLFTLLYLTKMSLALPIGFHFGWNFMQGPFWGLPVSGFLTKSFFQIEKISGMPFDYNGFGLEGSLLLTIIIIPIITFLFWKIRNKIFIRI